VPAGPAPKHSHPWLRAACAAALTLALLEAAPAHAQSGEAALAAAAAEPGAVRTPSGLVFRSLRDGTGAQPAATDTVRVNYRGTLPDGREFDSSYKRGQPANFALNRVIACWTEGVQKMKVGGKAKLVCPPSIAYGDRGAGRDVPPGATLIFEVELLDVAPAR
jgi:FKBP-type peptidyl-prolyl cis-trans isomerase FkpA